MTSIEILHTLTKDNLNLPGFHWPANPKNICVLFIPGMSGNILENYFAEVLGKDWLNKE